MEFNWKSSSISNNQKRNFLPAITVKAFVTLSVICNPIVFGFAGSVVKVEFKTHDLEWYYFSLDLNF